jgi:hypothetical protein
MARAAAVTRNKRTKNRPLKILLVADGHGAEIYVGALRDGFTKLGHDTRLFTWKDYFKNYPYANVYPTKNNPLASIYYRFQNKFTFGPSMLKLNIDLARQAQSFNPDLVFIYRGTHIYPATIRRMKRLGLTVFGYNNDDPFSPQYPSYFWRHFRRGIFAYDHLFAYRQKNLDDYKKLGYHHASLLRSYYVAVSNFPLPKPKKYPHQIVFAGHYENDGRDDTLKLLLDNGVDLKLYGTGWHCSKHYDYFTQKLGPIKPVYGADYNKALNLTAPLALAFLSKLNNDTYTRRSFEIPAAATCMVSEYTGDLAHNLYKPNAEAVYFKTPRELLAQVKKLLASPTRIKKIAQAGHKRLLKDGHEATDRCREILEVLKRPR